MQAEELSLATRNQEKLRTDLEASRDALQQLSTEFAEREQQLSIRMSQIAALQAAAAQSEQDQTAYVNQVCAVKDPQPDGSIRSRTGKILTILK